MPITQDRIFDLIEAGEDYRFALTTLINDIRQCQLSIASGRTSVTDGIAYLCMKTEDRLLARPVKTSTVLNTERIRYGLTRQENIRAKQYQKRKRAGMTSHQPKPSDTSINITYGPDSPEYQPPATSGPAGSDKEQQANFPKGIITDLE